MKTYWYLFPVIGLIWFIYDVYSWNNTKTPPIENDHLWQYLYPFYTIAVHGTSIFGIGFHFITK